MRRCPRDTPVPHPSALLLAALASHLLHPLAAPLCWLAALLPHTLALVWKYPPVTVAESQMPVLWTNIQKYIDLLPARMLACTQTTAYQNWQSAWRLLADVAACRETGLGSRPPLRCLHRPCLATHHFCVEIRFCRRTQPTHTCWHMDDISSMATWVVIGQYVTETRCSSATITCIAFSASSPTSTCVVPGETHKRPMQWLWVRRSLLLHVSSTLPLHHIIRGGLQAAPPWGEVQKAANHVALCKGLPIGLPQGLVHLAALEVSVAEALMVIANLQGCSVVFVTC